RELVLSWKATWKKGKNMSSVPVSLVSVIIAAALNLLIGYLWYSKWLFGPMWNKMCNHSKKEMCCDSSSIVYSAIVSLIIAYFIAFFQAHLGIATVVDGAMVGFFLWLGFVATTQISSVIWCRKPLKLFLLNTGAKLCAYLVMGGVLGK